MTDMSCEIEGCNGHQAWVVEKSNRTLRVCRRCMEEMTSIYGWRIKQ
jgi:hypothetical protein